MKTTELYLLSETDQLENIYVSGGGSLEYTIAEYVGIGIGFITKKLWKGFQAYSANLYELQKNSMIIHK
jgi:hypothetical protein